MGLDVVNAPFGNFHLSWAGTRWFSEWCYEHDLPNPFVGWVSGCNDGDQCVLGPGCIHTQDAREWCDAFETKFPDMARMARELLAPCQGILFRTNRTIPERPGCVCSPD